MVPQVEGCCRLVEQENVDILGEHPGEPHACAGADEPTPSETPAPVVTDDSGGVPVWVWFAAGGAVLAIVVILSVALVRRR